MSKKRIAVCGWKTGENSFGVTAPYLEYFSQFGTVEILTPQEGIRKDIDLVVMPGGRDSNPIKYGQVPGFMTSDPDIFKEYFMNKNLQQYIDAGIPIFGICLGFQQLNIHLGGSLTQHLLEHPFYSSRRDELVHEVYPVTDFKNDKWIYSRAKSDVFKVNSMHHQGVYIDQLGEGLVPLLFSEGPDYNGRMLVESFRHETLPIAGVQYHVEETYDNYATELINELLIFNEEKVLAN